MNDALLETLLHEEEGNSLDVKEEQYPFYGASSEEKSELLKDILAFANAWRRSKAYVLVGVKEVRGGRSEITGVENQLNDNDLQQFVNSKTQRPLSFRYVAYGYEEKQIGVVEIDLQRRPFYLEKAFGKLEAGAVYVRRGSSTATASPSEIAEMGAADTDQGLPTRPTLDLQFADLETRALLGTELALRSVVLSPKIDPEVLKPASNPLLPLAHFETALGQNPHFHEDFVEYVFQSLLLSPVAFALANQSSSVAVDIRMVARVSRVEGLQIHPHWEGPQAPNKHSLVVPRMGASQLLKLPEPDVSAYPDHFEIGIEFGKLRPQAKVFCTSPIFVGARSSMDLTLQTTLFGDNLPEPDRIDLKIHVDATQEPMKVAKVRELLNKMY